MPSNSALQGPAIFAPGAPFDLYRTAQDMRPIRYLISGVTKDSSGVPIGGVSLEVFETIPGSDNEPKGRLVNTGVSDAVGAYSVEVHSASGATFQVDAYKAGAPDIAGTTVNTLIGTPT